ncbi:hypothetical protein [Cellulosimicrobium protaetiae]|uniref:FtsX-like permease family protein n=1 Tax=Cellulosimicrobium protaetiae TaxID=2587808 RepID=A0A6M5UBS0_9MICO|nr:hypothetical protein [Cellulosimicrobium protaetiae]QJW35927.1 hypothetical protein FIC82_006690 [Cellulosimicrobium protaetiae]
MRSRGIRLAYAILAVYASLAAFVFLRAMDDLGPLGATDIVHVSGSAPSVPSAETIATIEHVAAQHDVNVVRFVEDLDDPAGARHLFLAVGDPQLASGSWLEDGYPSFSQDVRTSVHPLAERADMDPRGHYFTFGEAAATPVLAQALRAQGYTVETRAYYAPPQIMGWLVTQPLALSALVAALLVVVVVAASVLTNVRGYAVQRLHGVAPGRVLARDLRRALPSLLATLVAVAIADAVLLAVYNGGAQWPAFAAATAILTAAFVLLALGTHALALALAAERPVLEALKGRLPARATGVAVYLVRLPALLVAIAAVVGAGVAGVQLVAQAEASERWAAAGTAVHVLFSPNLSQEEFDALAVPAGEWMLAAEADGEIALAAQEEVVWGQGLPGRHESLLVNNAYLAQQDVRDVEGARIVDLPQDVVTVLVPSRYADAAASIADDVRTWTDGVSRGVQGVEIRTRVLAPGQELFTYGGASRPNQPPLLRDAVAVVVNGGSGVLDPDTYTSLATGQGVVVDDAETARAGLTSVGAQEIAMAFRPVALDAAQERAALVNDTRLHVFNAVVALAVLLATSVAVAQVSTRKNAQAIFARSISGWGFVRTHRGLLGAELVLALAVVAWSAWSTVVGLTATVRPGGAATSSQALVVLGPWQPVLLAGVVAASLAALAAALSVLGRRLVRTRSSEA